MRRIRFTLAKAIIGGVILSAAIPQVAYWGWEHAYAAPNPTALRSVNEMAQKITGAMINRRETITFTYEGKTTNLKSKVQAALDQAMGSDPYLYYIVDSYGYSYRGSSRSMNVTLQIKYLETLKQTAYVNKEVKKVLNGIITPGMNDHQKVKVIHDWVVLHLKYDTSYQKYTAYEGLYSGSAVCQGYSLLTYKMLKESGVPNKIVEGTAKPEGGRSQSHAWNLVYLDGRWYHLDTTWNDPTPDQTGVVSTEYYLRTDAQMRRDHSWIKSYPASKVEYPQTLSELVARGGANTGVYQKLQLELEYALYDEKQIIRSMSDLNLQVTKAISSGEKSLLFRYQGSASQLKSDLQGLYNLGLGLDQLSYTTSAFDNTGHLRVQIDWK